MPDFETMRALALLAVPIFLGIVISEVRKFWMAKRKQNDSVSSVASKTITIEIASLTRICLKPRDLTSSYILINDEEPSEENDDWEEDLGDFDEDQVGKNIKIMLPPGIMGQSLLQQLEKLEPSSRSGKTYKIVFDDYDDYFKLRLLEETDVIIKG